MTKTQESITHKRAERSAEEVSPFCCLSLSLFPGIIIFIKIKPIPYAVTPMLQILSANMAFRIELEKAEYTSKNKIFIPYVSSNISLQLTKNINVFNDAAILKLFGESFTNCTTVIT